MRNYYSGITVFKFFGSLLVLASHLFLFFSYYAMPTNVILIIKHTLGIVIPCFYVISGFLIYKGWTNVEHPKQYIKKYCSRLLIIYGVFCVYVIINIYIPNILRSGISFYTIITEAKHFIGDRFILLNKSRQFWFIPPLIFGTFVVFWIHEKYNRYLTLILFIVVIICQLVFGPFRSVVNSYNFTPYFLTHRYFIYISNFFILRYVGYGFVFVGLGVIISKYEKQFLKLKISKICIAAILITAIESIIIGIYPPIDNAPTLSMIPNTMLLFYGVLHIKIPKLKKYHMFINLFSTITFLFHIVLIDVTLYIFNLNKDVLELTIKQRYLLYVLIFLQCLILTVIWMWRVKIRTRRL